VLFVLLTYAVLRYPASLSQGGLVSLVIIAGALLAYAAAGLWSLITDLRDRFEVTA